MLLGAIADDLTGATDLSLMLARNGMRTTQYIGVPPADADFEDAEAVVVALKSRTIPASEAIALSTHAARALIAAGAEQLMFKYCSTFDSTDAGNIGPVAEALLKLVDAPMTIACPAFPAAGRTVYQGHLFVGGALLSDSPMKDHPLTPMRDSNLVRVLQRQSEGKVGLIPSTTIMEGADAIRAALATAEHDGFRLMIADAIRDEDLRLLGEAVAGARLVTGGSGIAMGLPGNFRRRRQIDGSLPARRMAAPRGQPVMLAGSCSGATRVQVKAAIDAGVPALKVDPIAIASGEQTSGTVARWVRANTTLSAALVYSSAEPEAVGAAQSRLGRAAAGTLVEDLLAEVACSLRDAGFSRFVVAGGETSGAVVQALGVRSLRIGPEIAEGVPWTRSIGMPDLALALKSGNFGGPDFFTRAWDLLDD